MLAFSNRICRSSAAPLYRRIRLTRPFVTKISTAKSVDENFLSDDNRKAYAILLAATVAAGTSILSFSSKDSVTASDAGLIATGGDTNAIRRNKAVEFVGTVGVNEADECEEDKTTIVNWSGTHTVDLNDSDYYEPETVEELEAIVTKCNNNGKSIRPVGSALSPNGISFNPSGMVSLSNLDRILKVDKDNMTVTVQSGARVSQVIDMLRVHNLTLPNLASIAEQQMGGFTQIGAHGTGAAIPPIDDFVTSLRLVTPSKGTMTLTDSDGELFHLAKVGLGCLGIVSELTIKCIPAHNLLEHTFVLTRAEAKKQLNDLLKKHKHVRYMWIPYEDTVVVVTNDPEDENSKKIVEEAELSKRQIKEAHPLKELLIKLTKRAPEPYTEEILNGKGFGALRDDLIGLDPLNVDHMKQVNRAEAHFWKQSEGYQLKPSDELLQFDCGGQQWVYEVCCPTGTYDKNDGNDMKFMEDLLSKIESEKIPAHPPIEQRWTASSSSLMSPAYGEKRGLFFWVGIIMYLPDEGEEIRKKITDAFKVRFCDLVKKVGGVKTVSHWGKLEMPTSESDYDRLKDVMSRRYPVEKFNAARFYFDPKNICGSNLINTLIGTPTPVIRKKDERS